MKTIKKPKLLTKEQVATALTCSQRTISRLVASGDLEAVLVGGMWRCREEELDRFLHSLPNARGVFRSRRG
jgi:excisionase family DNA binding protein